MKPEKQEVKLNEREQKKAFLLNNMRKLLYMDESNLENEQKKEIVYAKSIINNELEKLKHGLKINEQVFIEVKDITNKYSKYIKKEYYY